MQAYAVTPPGFEDLTAGELGALGLRVGAREKGGVEFSGDWGGIYRANLMSRVASRILVRVSRFEASTFPILERRLACVDWRRWLPPAGPVDVRVTSRRTRLYHTGKVAEVVRGVLGRSGATRSDEPAARLQVRISEVEVTVSVDTSGDHLHRRGYRLETGRAPLRENLVAGLLMRAAWDGSEPLLDPFCGSGTFPIEGALLALRIPPGRLRHFAFEKFPSFDPRRWQALRERAEAGVRKSLPQPVFAADQDAEALRLTARSARRAGLGEEVQVALEEVADLAAPAATGLLVANPPHGRRLGGERSAHSALGRALRGPFQGWRWGLVVRGREALDLRPSEVFRFRSGGLGLGFTLGGPTEAGPGGRTRRGVSHGTHGNERKPGDEVQRG
jgi:putative N6-adenine-specific DNA methylase